VVTESQIEFEVVDLRAGMKFLFHPAAKKYFFILCKPSCSIKMDQLIPGGKQTTSSKLWPRARHNEK